MCINDPKCLRMSQHHLGYIISNLFFIFVYICFMTPNVALFLEWFFEVLSTHKDSPPY